MTRRRLALLFGLPLCAALGCFEEQNSMLVPSSPFGGPEPAAKSLAAHAPATQEAAMKVIATGKKLLDANQHLALRVMFVTVGSPAPEVFHVGATQVVVTEGLVKLCEGEEQLAAVLSLELGKMASEREAQAGLATRNANREPPPSPGVGADGGGSRGGGDFTELAEKAPYEQVRRRQIHPPPPPDPKVLATTILTRAGYSDTALTAAEPLLKSAAENSALEKQMAGPPPGAGRPWTQAPTGRP
jgi:hypothetical protein